MSNLRAIEIDFDVHKAIEAARSSFEETPNDVLRHLLKIEARPIQPEPAHTLATQYRAWIGKGVSLPHGTTVRMEYNGRSHAGTIDDGAWLVEGQRFSSPSGAAGGVAVTKSGGKTLLDGWIYWEVRRPGDVRWMKLNKLRKD